MDCNEIAQEELKRLRDMQRLLQFLAKKETVQNFVSASDS